MRTLIVIGCLGMLAPHAVGEPTEEQLAWLRERAVVIDTVEAGNGFDDLEPLREMIGDARIVALGEHTHGTREVFQMKHRLVEFLASEMGFTIFSIEANMPEAYRVNDYVHGGEGDAAALIDGMYFWTWDTDAVHDMVEWMRAFNAQHDDKRIDFTGFDMQTPDVAMEIVLGFLAEHDPQTHESARGAYASISRVSNQGGAALATGTFPVEEARGKRVRYSARIATEDVEGGFATLWWRVDGAEDTVLAFENMSERAPRGTTDWHTYAIEIDVPDEATNINFGLILSGSGAAWFDDLTIELDGERVRAHGFEADEQPLVRPFPPAGFSATLDEERADAGARSLRLAGDPAAEPGVLIKNAQSVVRAMEARRDALVASAGEEATAWAIQNARVVEQATRLTRAGMMLHALRDRAMADNVMWILERNPEAKIVLWAHNMHNAKTPPWLGHHLASAFGDDYVSIAFASASGTYTALRDGTLRRDNELAEPPAASFDRFFGAVGPDAFLIDLRAASLDDPASSWLLQFRPWRDIGALATDDGQYRPQMVAMQQDAVLFLKDTTATRPIER